MCENILYEYIQICECVEKTSELIDYISESERRSLAVHDIL